MNADPRAYVTYFDQRYLSRAIAMLRSLRRNDPDAEIFALCFDQTTHDIIADLDGGIVNVVAPKDILEFEPALADCSDRGLQAFYATHKPVLPLYVLKKRPTLRAIAHIDADTYFFSPVAPLFEEIGNASIALSPHRFSKIHNDLQRYGRFNAGFIYWRNDEAGLRCLTEYRDDCLRWCGPEVEQDGRFMNQGYLTAWPQRYPSVHVIGHPGANLSWWNVADHSLAGSAPHGLPAITVDGEPLVFFHFSYVALDSNGIWRTLWREFGNNLNLALEAIYAPYLRQIEDIDRALRRRQVAILPADKGWTVEKGKPVRRGPWPRTQTAFFERARYFALDLLMIWRVVWRGFRSSLRAIHDPSLRRIQYVDRWHRRRT